MRIKESERERKESREAIFEFYEFLMCVSKFGVSISMDVLPFIDSISR
jgi:hypothetical protein